MFKGEVLEKNMNKVFAIVVFLCVCLMATAQNVPYYSFQKLTEPYQSLTNSTSINNGLQWDDPDILIPANMDFVTFGQTYNTLYLSVMGAGLSNLGEDGIGLESTVYVVLSPMLADLVDPCLDFDDFGGGKSSGKGLKRFREEGDPGSCSNLSYQIDGTLGSRIFKFEWQNASLYDALDSCSLNMQVWYYEENHAVEYRYGPSVISNDDFFEAMQDDMFAPVILREDLVSEVMYVAIVSGDPDYPTFFCGSSLDSLDDGEYDAGLTHYPSPNTVYRFEPTIVGVQTHELPGISVSPNPVSDQLFIHGADHATVEIFNVAGQLILTQPYLGPINTSDLSSGVYFVKVSQDGRYAVKKVMKCE